MLSVILGVVKRSVTVPKVTRTVIHVSLAQASNRVPPEHAVDGDDLELAAREAAMSAAAAVAASSATVRSIATSQTWNTGVTFLPLCRHFIKVS
jgi:hypothetical protein